MKTTLLYILILFGVLVYIPNAQAQDIDTRTSCISTDDYLNEIQNKIDQAFHSSLKNKDVAGLLKIEEHLKEIASCNKNRLVNYWQSYTAYHLSICHLQLNRKKLAEKAIFKAIGQINELKNKNSEDYALLANEQSYSCQFRPGIVIPFITKKLKANCEMALKADSANLRAWFVMGSHDFYTPEMYGGGKITEKMLMKAISLPEQKVINPYLPSWGKSNAYELLIRWYIRKEKWQQARKYYKEGIQLFPKSFLIQQLKDKIQLEE